MGGVLVTGGAGFIGSHAAEHFALGHNKVVVCDNLSRVETLGKCVGDPLYSWNYLKERYRNITLLKLDVTSVKDVKEAFEDVDTVVHAAGQVAVTKSMSDPRRDFEINAVGTFNILERARLNDCAVIFCSTNKVYGENVNAIPIKEEAKRYVFSDPAYENGIPEDLSIDHAGHSPYGSSKLAADIYVQEYGYTYGLKTGVFRMSCIAGERQFGVEDQGWLSWFTIATLTGQPITIYGDGKQVRDILYVKDLVRAFEQFLQSNTRQDVFNIGGGPGNTLSLLELLEMLRNLTGRQPRLSFGDWRRADQRVYVSDIRKLRRKLSWKPTTTAQESVKRMVDWVDQNPALPKK